MTFIFELSAVDPDPEALGGSTLQRDLDARGLREVVAADCQLVGWPPSTTSPTR